LKIDTNNISFESSGTESLRRLTVFKACGPINLCFAEQASDFQQYRYPEEKVKNRFLGWSNSNMAGVQIP